MNRPRKTDPAQPAGQGPRERGQPSAPAGQPSAPAPAFLYSTLRFIARHVHGFWPAMAAFVGLGLAAGALLTAIFALLAAAVGAGITRHLDERVLRWLADRRVHWLDEAMSHVTTLGDGIVVTMLVFVVSVFLWLTWHRWSVYLLLVGVLGGQVVNNILKLVFNRARPEVMEWAAEVRTLSFPSGHAMSAIMAYGTVAYLVGRLEPTPRLRRATWAMAAAIILGIGFSRIYLGVHYPSDVLGGFIAGLAWLAFVAASMEAIRFFAPRRPQTAREERDLDAGIR
jgi:undecaprenyl-diphosphatase